MKGMAVGEKFEIEKVGPRARRIPFAVKKNDLFRHKLGVTKQIYEFMTSIRLQAVRNQLSGESLL